MTRLRFSALKIDRFLLILVGTVALATLVPARGQAASAFDVVSNLAIALLFFLHGAKLSRQAVLEGIGAWRIHVAVVGATFVMFPLIGLAARSISDLWLNPHIGAGLLLLCLMPSTVQSSIAFTSIARGNVPAAVCSASLSNLIGIALTPLLVGTFLSSNGGGFSWEGATKIALQLLLPFVSGHLARPLLARSLARYKTLVSQVDRSVILLVVYTAFSAAVVEGLWSRYTPGDLGWTVAIDAVILAIALAVTTGGARLLGFDTADEVVIVFCGSKKSLASGVPMATALFPTALVGPMLLPLMLFHQLQLMACATLAERYAAGSRTASDPGLGKAGS